MSHDYTEHKGYIPFVPILLFNKEFNKESPFQGKGSKNSFIKILEWTFPQYTDL